VTSTPTGDWYSVGICSDGSYGIEEGKISSFPIRTAASGREVVQNIRLNNFSRHKIDASVPELLEEKELVAELL
jgi:malate dehydrogenase